MRAHQMQVAAIVAADTNAPLHVVHRRGARRRATVAYFMRLKPRSERQLNADEVIQNCVQTRVGRHQCLPAKSAVYRMGG